MSDIPRWGRRAQRNSGRFDPPKGPPELPQSLAEELTEVEHDLTVVLEMIGRLHSPPPSALYAEELRLRRRIADLRAQLTIQ